ncbi:hypothetical protein WJX72_011238 [[Myrmecia] bisecta]|uniref:Nudix hydrolase domain-containing protein n=1 Tax=[Myrmecia] bisecta TaxID=41462 RepID=A0AAW1P9D6_9CHLO
MIELSAYGGAYPEPAAFSRSAAAVIHRESREGVQVLLVQDNRNGWSLPAGGAKPQETSLAAAVRETLEETGVAADPATAQWLGYSEMAGPLGEQNSLVTYAMRAVSGEAALVPQAAEVRAAQWFSIRDAVAASEITNVKQALEAFEAGRGRPVQAAASKPDRVRIAA